MKVNDPGFEITSKKGVRITFPNGITVSAQWGPGNYCSNRDCDWDSPAKSIAWISEDCEVAVWRNSHEPWLTNEVWSRMRGEELGDDVVGYITPEVLLEILVIASKL